MKTMREELWGSGDESIISITPTPDGVYAEKLKFKPSSKAYPTLILSGITKKVEVIL